VAVFGSLAFVKVAGPRRSAIPNPRPNHAFVSAYKDRKTMSQSPTAAPPVFYACIPDIPDGPPFEIAWATLESGDDRVTCESRLIRPPTSWSPPLTRHHPAVLRAYGLKLPDMQQFGAPTGRSPRR
jgi:hypothetical protein